MQPFGFAQPPPPRARGAASGLVFSKTQAFWTPLPLGGGAGGGGLREDKSFNFNHLFQVGNRVPTVMLVSYKPIVNFLKTNKP